MLCVCARLDRNEGGKCSLLPASPRTGEEGYVSRIEWGVTVHSRGA